MLTVAVLAAVSKTRESQSKVSPNAKIPGPQSVVVEKVWVVADCSTYAVRSGSWTRTRPSRHESIWIVTCEKVWIGATPG